MNWPVFDFVFLSFINVSQITYISLLVKIWLSVCTDQLRGSIYFVHLAKTLHPMKRQNFESKYFFTKLSKRMIKDLVKVPHTSMNHYFENQRYLCILGANLCTMIYTYSCQLKCVSGNHRFTCTLQFVYMDDFVHTVRTRFDIWGVHSRCSNLFITFCSGLHLFSFSCVLISFVCLIVIILYENHVYHKI